MYTQSALVAAIGLAPPVSSTRWPIDSTMRAAAALLALATLATSVSAAVEVTFSGHYPARLGSALLERALAAGAYTHTKLGDGSDAFDASEGEQHFRIQYDHHHADWVLGAIRLPDADAEAGRYRPGAFEPLLHASAARSQRHSPAEVTTQWRVYTEGVRDGRDVGTPLEDVLCEYPSEATRLEAATLRVAAEKADAEEATRVAEELAAAEALAAEQAAAVEAAAHAARKAREDMEAAEEAERQRHSHKRRGGRHAGTQALRSAADRKRSNDHMMTIVTALAAFVALVILLVGIYCLME